MLPEYGRHIHKMVDYLSSIHDRDLRNSQTKVVIEVMGNVNPVLRDAVDFKHKLWDHLFIISDFKLDVDSPYPKPEPEMFNSTPRKMEYPSGKILHKHYGKNVQTMLSAIKNSPDEEDKTLIAGNIAKYMRAKYFEYNQEHPNNETICKDIRKMSENLITIDEVALNNLKNDYQQPHTNNRQRKNFSQNNQNSGSNGQKGGQRNAKQNNKYRTGKSLHK